MCMEAATPQNLSGWDGNLGCTIQTPDGRSASLNGLPADGDYERSTAVQPFGGSHELVRGVGALIHQFLVKKDLL